VWNVDSIHIEIRLTNCFNRQLAAFEVLMHLLYHASKENEIVVKKDIQLVDLNASHLEIARDVIKRIFMMFNWNDPQDSMIEGWQKKLIGHGVY
jgi:hypothetical protein